MLLWTISRRTPLNHVFRSEAVNSIDERWTAVEGKVRKEKWPVWRVAVCKRPRRFRANKTFISRNNKSPMIGILNRAASLPVPGTIVYRQPGCYDRFQEVSSGLSASSNRKWIPLMRGKTSLWPINLSRAKESLQGQELNVLMD